VTAARYLYRRHGLNAFAGWNVLGTALADRESASSLISEWNRRDRGEWVWRFAECLPDDYDHPLRKAAS